LFNNAFKEIKKKLKNEKNIVLLTDENVYKIYETYLNKITKNIVIIKAKEKNKNIKNILKIYYKFIELKVDKSFTVVSFGGGIVSDIAGFVSSTYMRGLNFVIIPTTLLSLIDASIGGKTGFNYKGIKNLIGTFKKPKFIIPKLSFLKTLKKQEIKNGVFEAIKCALIKDKNLFLFLKNSKKNILNLDTNTIKHLYKKTKKIKQNFVKKDFKDKNIRNVLNFGHTFAHTIEENLRLSHGEAVGLGMIFSSFVSFKKAYINQKTFNEILNLINKYKNFKKLDFTKDLILSKIFFDKKKQNNEIRFILITDIGRYRIEKISLELLESYLDDFCKYWKS
jgi:3-dehydroquinate synthase